MTIHNNKQMPQMTAEQAAIINNMTPEQQQLMNQMIQQVAGQVQQTVVPLSKEYHKNSEQLPNQQELYNLFEEPAQDFRKVLHLDFSDIKLKEDFFNDRLYNIIFDENISADKRMTIVMALKNKAKEIGGCRFQDDIGKICKVREKELQDKIKEEQKVKISGIDESGFRTNFTCLPDFSTGNKICGHRFKADDNGIFEMIDEYGRPCENLLCRTHMLINREAVLDCGYNEGDSVKVELIYRKLPVYFK